MNNFNMHEDIDVLVVFQDRELVTHIITQIQKLGLKVHTLFFDVEKIDEIIALQPKIVLLSSNNVINTMKFYIEYLESYDEEIAAHSAVLLINNKDSEHAYLACENGLFDDYVVINPYHEPFRLNLILLHLLEMERKTNDEGLNKLIESGECELAECISYGRELKTTFDNQILSCQTSLAKVTSTHIEENISNELIHKSVEDAFDDLKQSISIQVQSMLDHMMDARQIQQQIKLKMSKHLNPKECNRLTAGLDLNALIKQIENKNLSEKKPYQFKLLIAEHSDLFIRELREIFLDTKFNFEVSRNGIDALLKVSEYKPDVILLSYDLSGVNGFEFTKRLRDSDNKTPIVAFSHQNDKSVISKWIQLGLNGYIIKPSTRENVINTVVKAVNNPHETLYLNKNSEKIEWLPEYSIGNKVIDEQHKELFSLINDFFKNDKQESVKKIFNKLAKYIEIHFKAEEALLAEIDYPNIKAHIAKHKALTNKFEAIKHRLDEYNDEEHHKIAMFLYNWLSKHILQEDMDYKAFAQKKFNVNASN
jgi:hemerythrin-like metal-binding protein